MAGRPKAEIDWNRVDRLLEAQCTGTEIAATLGVHPNTLYQACEKRSKCNFSEYSQQKKESGKRLLKAKQFEVAMSGDKAMLIWLGKQYLEQRDKADLDHSGEVGFRTWQIQPASEDK